MASPSRFSHFCTGLFAAFAWALAAAPSALALDKQGSAHGGDVEGSADGFGISGNLVLGVALYNPSYAARPDNTGKTLMRYAGHSDIDLIGRRLSLPVDLNVFSDRTRTGIGKLAPTELDMISGITTTWELGPGAAELGARFEHDRPVDRGGASQTYVDARARYLYSLDKLWPGLASGLRQGDISGWLALGWFAYNPSYYARPDNTGRALLRYALHGELSVMADLFSLGLDSTMFTDRFAADPVRPSELDITPEIIFHKGDWELHLAYETDLPIDRGGLVQRFLYLLGVWSFSAPGQRPPLLEDRGQIISP